MASKDRLPHVLSGARRTAWSAILVGSASVLNACGGSGSSHNPIATHLSVTGPTGAVAGTAFNVTVTALDSTNGVVTSYAGTVHITSTDPQIVRPVDGPLTNGIGTFAVTLQTVAAETVTATDTVTSSITGTSGSIQVSSALAFTPTGHMSTTREVHTATLLNDGKVLVVGGMHWAATPGCVSRCSLVLSALTSADLFDPADGAFTPTGELSVPRVYHTATLLGNGKVLVVGGDDRGTARYASAELFNPATGTFSPTGNMSVARSGHTATLLANGRVLVTGSAAPGDTSAELFDPATGTFSPTGNMTVARFFHTATLLTDGRVLVAGGVGGGDSTAEIYDPTTGIFSPTGSMSVARSSHTATLLANGKVLVAGGGAAGNELFDPVTGTFAPTGDMITPRYLHTATRLGDGTVLVTGGIDGNAFLSSAELFDPANGSFTAMKNMGYARAEHRAALLATGEVLIVGGFNLSIERRTNSLSTAELFR